MRDLKKIMELGFSPLNYGQVTACIIRKLNQPMPPPPDADPETLRTYVPKTYMEGMVQAIIDRALNGDPRCFELLVDRVEGKAVQQPNIMQLLALLAAVPPDALDLLLKDYRLAQDEQRLIASSDDISN